MLSGGRIYTIPASVPFLGALAAGLIGEAGDDPLALGAMTVLMPTRRACRAFAEAALAASGGRPLLLPRLLPLGELDEADEVRFGEDAFDRPPPIGPLRRQMLLARLIMAAADSEPIAAGQAARLAAELARLLDQVETERLDFGALASLVPEDYAVHWQRTLGFLRILTDAWPTLLKAEGCDNPAAHRDAVLTAQAERWRRHPPAGHVVAAGSTGSIPATAALISVVARLPQGAVVLPGLDQRLDAQTWAALEASHPQYGLARLLEALDVERADVGLWPGVGQLSAKARARQALISEAMRPALTTDTWRRQGLAIEAALDGVQRLDCPGPEEEARAIALMLRETLETPQATAALVTSDRALARRVAAEMRRWRIEIDDSAGFPLGETAPGGFLRLIATLAADDVAPVALLALLKHPLAAGGLAPGEFRGRVRQLELAVLRGPRPAPGFSGLGASLEIAAREQLAWRALPAWFDGIAAAGEPFLRAASAEHQDAADMLAAHVAFAEWLAASVGESGAERLWLGEAGEAAARFVADLLAAAQGFGRLDGRDYRGLFDALMTGAVVRPSHGRHPRLAIWGPLEARLQQADHLILGGLNEGTWPGDPGTDPWMSRPMRERFGLPALERRIGQSAHDFAQAFSAPRVTLTRAERVAGTPTVPSRWLLRLDGLLAAGGRRQRPGDPGRWLAWQAALDRPAAQRVIEPPRPCPPVACRPRRLSVTQIETWLRDPYAIYARHVLGLRPLDPIDGDPGAAERGTLIHQALDRFVGAVPGPLPPDALDQLMAIGRAAFRPLIARPTVWAFWWPRFERIARWFVEIEGERRAGILHSATELRGELAIEAPGGPFLLTGTADRIDRLSNGALTIIDYKSGQLPSKGDVEEGASPQLPLEAAMAAAGGFAGLAPGLVEEIAYWRVSGGDPPGEVRPAGTGTAKAAADAALQGLARYIAAFDDPTMPYLAVPRPDMAPAYNDYAHLARIAEWSRQGGGSE